MALPFTTLVGRRVAVIDDDPAVVAAMRALFSAWGATVAGGGNVDAASAELTTLAKTGGNPLAALDLIVADLRLADGQCGLDAVARLRQIVGACSPALIVSGDTGEEARASVGAAGFTLLSKPVTAAALQSAATAALDAARAENSAAA